MLSMFVSGPQGRLLVIFHNTCEPFPAIHSKHNKLQPAEATEELTLGNWVPISRILSVSWFEVRCAFGLGKTIHPGKSGILQQMSVTFKIWVNQEIHKLCMVDSPYVLDLVGTVIIWRTILDKS